VWWRFYNSGWYDACLVVLFAAAMLLLFNRFAPEIGPAIENLIALIQSGGPEVEALSVLVIFGLLVWVGVWQINHWLRIER
jgi:hypothetical protein